MTLPTKACLKMILLSTTITSTTCSYETGLDAVKEHISILNTEITAMPSFILDQVDI